MQHPRSLPDILCRRAIEEPDRTAFRFLVDGTGAHAVEWTYRDLARHAAAIADELGAPPAGGGRAVLALPPGLAYVGAVFGILHAGWTAVPAFPPVGRRATERFAAIVADSAPDLVLTDPRVVEGAVAAGLAATGPEARPRWLAVPAHEGAGCPVEDL